TGLTETNEFVAPCIMGIENDPWLVAGVSLLVVALIVALITIGFCLGRHYCCKSPSVVLNAGSPGIEHGIIWACTEAAEAIDAHLPT
ncbi:hypothetical protein PENTCL1PPCAC_18566, partial [Pristionchus entomophagus]